MRRKRGIWILTLLFAVSLSSLVWSADRSYDDSTKKTIENVKNGVDRFKDRVQDKWKVEKITRNGVTTDVSDALNDFKKSAETLKDRYKSDYAANPDALEFLQKAKKVDDFMKTHQGQTGSDTEWLELRRNLVSLASAYNIDFESDSSNWKATRKTDNEMKNLSSSLEGSFKSFGKNLDQASKQANVAPDVRKDIEAAEKSLEKSVKALKDAVGGKKPAGAALQAVQDASSALASKLDSAGLTSAVSGAWSAFQNGVGGLSSAMGNAQM